VPHRQFDRRRHAPGLGGRDALLRVLVEVEEPAQRGIGHFELNNCPFLSVELLDAVQQVFLKVISELQKYKVDYFKSWLYMVARNHCLMKLRDKTGRLVKEVDDSMQIPAEDTEPAVEMEKDMMLEYITAALQELSDEQKTCVTLFYLDKKSYTDITVITGFTLMQVKSYIQNGKRNLKLLVEKKMKQ